MKDLKRFLVWACINSVFIAAFYAGFILDIGGAKNIAIFYAWFVVVCSLVFNTAQIIEHLRMKGRPFYDMADNILDLLVVAVFAWFGCTITAIAFAVATILSIVAKERAWGEK